MDDVKVCVVCGNEYGRKRDGHPQWAGRRFCSKKCKGVGTRVPILDRLAGKFEIDHETGCWNWTDFRGPGGYGLASYERKTRPAHRVMYEVVVGPIPDGLTIDHLCRNPSCVNPDHLEPVTQRENNLRGFGTSGLNAWKTHCKNGHEFTPENTYTRRDTGGRQCKTCKRERDRRRAV